MWRDRSFRVLRIVLALVLVPVGASAAREPSIPPMVAADLNGKSMNLPGDLSGDPSVWVVAFDRNQQGQVDRLFGLLRTAQAAAPGLEFWEVPVIENPGAIARWFIDTGMRSGIPKTETRAKVVTLYVADRAQWLKQAGVGSTDQAYAVKVGKGGDVLAVASQSTLQTAADVTAFIGAPPAAPADR
jgi:hypothetical protein